jgi:hypothetical protein
MPTIPGPHRTEFGFDMVRWRRTATPDRYHDFIGFNISQHLLENLQNLRLKLSDVLVDERPLGFPPRGERVHRN